MPPRSCPACKSTKLATDYSAGNVVCQDCGLELENNLLVSEIGFSEGAGGRVHVQGTFVSHSATGIAGRNAGVSSERIKEEGRKRIQLICQQMGILPSVQRGAQRFYSLAVDNKFNRGRRTDYVVASCIYLYSRFEKDALMLIDFSERLQINVYELGATYLKLRSALNLDQILPEIDPAVYNIRFANRLDFGDQASVVARDASRLVKRFKADWMTSGRRPAGICGACLVIAARMSNFLRTPEEVAQVVKVSPITIRKRLVEFAQTTAATKTVEEWRALTDADLEAEDTNELPPIMKREKAKAEKERVKREREEAGAEGEGEGGEGGEGEDGAAATAAIADPDDRSSSAKRPRTRHDDMAANGALQATVAELESVDGDAAEAKSDDDETMDPMSKEDYVKDIQKAGDNSDEAKAKRAREKRQLMASMRHAAGTDAADDDDDELHAIAVDEKEDDLDEDKEDGGGDDDDDDNAVFGGFRNIPPPPVWSDKQAVYQYIEEHFFHDQEALYGGNRNALRERIDRWLQGRTAEEVIGEMRRVEWAHHEREWFAKHHHETEFSDLDDDELDMYWVMDDDERQARARMWLSHNGKWLEEDKERQEKKAAYNRARGIDPNKPKAKKRRGGGIKVQKGPYPSARDAMESFASQKKFSSRINMDAIRRLQDDGNGASGSGSGSRALPRASQYQGLQSMSDDDKDDDDKDDDEAGYLDEKYDEKYDENDKYEDDE